MEILMLALVGGLIVGVLLGALGGGGSILVVPLLVYGAHLGAHQATAGSLLVVGVSALAGAISHSRSGTVRWREGITFAVVGSGGTVLGSRAAAGVAPQVLLGTFAVLVLVVAVLLFRRSARSSDRVGDSRARVHWLPLVLVAVGVGFLTGFFGVGGGFAIVPALTLVLKLPMRQAVGTSLLVIAINSGTALAARAGSLGSLEWGVLIPFAAVTIPASWLGNRVAGSIDPRLLTRGFAVLLVAVSVYMLAQLGSGIMG